MLKIGVIGAGHLGKIHIKCLKGLPEVYHIGGFYDADPENASKVAQELNITPFASLEELIEQVDCVDIVTPTTTHYDIALKAIEAGKHFFIEKPVTTDVTQGEHLLKLATEKNLCVQVGHVERFNPAVESVLHLGLEPKFIEAHRLANFNPRGTDVSVVLDLMIHDLDLLLYWVKSPVVHIHASGVAVISNTPDIANARIEFENGCVANLTASRISMKQMRKVRLFQKDAYISLDLLEKEAQVIRMFSEKPEEGMTMPIETGETTKYISIEMPPAPTVNAIQEELRSFSQSILAGKPIKVDLKQGVKVLKLAYQIINNIHERGQFF